MYKSHNMLALCALLFPTTFAQDDGPAPEGVDIFFLPHPGCPGADGELHVANSWYNGSCNSLLGSNPASAQIGEIRTDAHQQMDLFGDEACTQLLFSVTNDGLNGTTDIHSLGESGCVTAPDGSTFQAMRYTTAGLSNPGPQPVSNGNPSNPGPSSVSTAASSSTAESDPGPLPVGSSTGLSNPGPAPVTSATSSSTDLSNPGPQPVSSSPELSNPGPTTV